MSRLLAFDIETYAAWGDLDPELQDYLVQREQSYGRAPDPRAAAADRIGLLPGVAQVIAIGLWEEDQAVRLSLVPAVDEARRADDDGLELRFESEAALLAAFWGRVGDAVEAGARLVSFNGRRFDGPVLLHRSAVLGVTPSVDLCCQGLRPHCDLREVLSFFGASKGYALRYWCHVYGVPSPKQGLDGAGVAAAYERGEHEAIARYALADARATGRLLRKLEPTVLPLLEARGP